VSRGRRIRRAFLASALALGAVAAVVSGGSPASAATSRVYKFTFISSHNDLDTDNAATNMCLNTDGVAGHWLTQEAKCNLAGEIWTMTSVGYDSGFYPVYTFTSYFSRRRAGQGSRSVFALLPAASGARRPGGDELVRVPAPHPLELLDKPLRPRELQHRQEVLRPISRFSRSLNDLGLSCPVSMSCVHAAGPRTGS
jgi:hypothetical protein